MNKVELAEKVAYEARLTKKDAIKVVDSVFECIVNSLENGEEVKISKFGTFKVKRRKARTGINPITKETIGIESQNALVFQASSNVKEILNK